MSNYNLGEESMRKNKKELFYQINDSLIAGIQSYLQNKQTKTQIIYGFTQLADSGDRAVYEIMKKDTAVSAIVINHFDIYFEQSNVETNKSADGTSKRAYYNISSLIRYSYYDTNHLIKSSEVNYSEAHSNRPVFSGLFASGPNIVSNKKDALTIATKNVVIYFDSYFPGN